MPFSNGVLQCMYSCIIYIYISQVLGYICLSATGYYGVTALKLLVKYSGAFAALVTTTGFPFSFPPFLSFWYCGVKALKLLVKYSGAFAAPRFPFFFRFQEDSRSWSSCSRTPGASPPSLLLLNFPPFFLFLVSIPQTGIATRHLRRSFLFQSPPSSLFLFTLLHTSQHTLLHILPTLLRISLHTEHQRTGYWRWLN